MRMRCCSVLRWGRRGVPAGPASSAASSTARPVPRIEAAPQRSVLLIFPRLSPYGSARAALGCTGSTIGAVFKPISRLALESGKAEKRFPELDA